MDFDTLKECRKTVMGAMGRNYLKKIKIKGVKSWQVRYFMRTGRDVHNGRIIKFIKSIKTEIKEEINVYNQTIEVSDFDLSEMATRLELRYKNKRFFTSLHRELNEQGYKCTYHTVWRLFNEFRDTSGGKLLDEVKRIANSQ